MVWCQEIVFTYWREVCRLTLFFLTIVQCGLLFPPGDIFWGYVCLSVFHSNSKSNVQIFPTWSKGEMNTFWERSGPKESGPEGVPYCKVTLISHL